MTARTGAKLLAGCGLGLVVLAGASWVAPLLGLWLLGIAGALWWRPAPAAAAWAVVGGGLTLLAGLSLALVGEITAGLLCAALGAGAGVVGTQLSLAAHPRTPRPLPAPFSPRTQLAVGADEAMKWYWHVTGLVSPAPDPSLWLESLRAAAERNRESGVLRDPTLAHPAPPALEKHALRRFELAGLPSAEELCFESEFQPRDVEVRERYIGVRANRTARALLWRHAGSARPTLIVIHGYGMGGLGSTPAPSTCRGCTSGSGSTSRS